MPTERPPLVGEVVPTFADRECCEVSATDHPVVSLGFLDRSRYYFFQVAPQLSSRGLVNPVPDPLLLRKSGSAGNRTQDLWICSQKLWPLDHRGGHNVSDTIINEYEALGGMRIGRENWNAQRKPVLVSLCSPQISHDLKWDRTRVAAVRSRRITA
jgi:hypothetical protein